MSLSQLATLTRTLDERAQRLAQRESYPPEDVGAAPGVSNWQEAVSTIGPILVQILQVLIASAGSKT